MVPLDEKMKGESYVANLEIIEKIIIIQKKKSSKTKGERLSPLIPCKRFSFIMLRLILLVYFLILHPSVSGQPLHDVDSETDYFRHDSFLFFFFVWWFLYGTFYVRLQ